jgi:uncharacterized membrane protein YoaK (UPF0700 family)
MREAWRDLLAPQRHDLSNQRLGVILAFVAGAANAGGFLVVGRYTSHMSGIVASMANDLAAHAWPAALSGLALVAAFTCGAAGTAVMVNLARRSQLHSVYALPILVEALLLSLLGMLGSHLASFDELTVPVAALLLCFMMGLQNALITKASDAIIRTTHVTGMVTDLGIELGKLFYWNRHPEDQATPKVLANRPKMRILALLLGAFFGGGLAGAWGFANLGFIFVAPFVLLLLALAWPHLAADLQGRKL